MTNAVNDPIEIDYDSLSDILNKSTKNPFQEAEIPATLREAIQSGRKVLAKDAATGLSHDVILDDEGRLHIEPGR